MIDQRRIKQSLLTSHVLSCNDELINVCEGLRSRCGLPECKDLTLAESGRSLCFTTIL